MARHNVIVKKLASVETLGGTNIICTDKTGTLTQNRMDVSWIYLDGKSTELVPNVQSRKIVFQGSNGNPMPKPLFHLATLVSVLCSTSELNLDESGERVVGDPLEIGLLRFAYCSGMDIRSVRGEYPKVKVEPIRAETRMMATLHRTKSDYFTAAKGSVEELLKVCSRLYIQDSILDLNEDMHRQILQDAERAASSGLRVIGLGCSNSQTGPHNLFEDLVWLGMIGMIDPVHEDVPDAIEQCHKAGIEVIMMTGDHPMTDKNIAAPLGLDTRDAVVVTGKDMDLYDTPIIAVKKKWRNAKGFARVSPKNKLDLVNVHQEADTIVAMTGDRVNDAPALQKADIGITMGIRGTQVTQGVADMVIRDNAFTSIVEAIRQGRVIFENIRKFITFFLSCNLSELLIIATVAALNLPFQLLPLQILFINLVTDVFPALAIGKSKGGRVLMSRPPRNPKMSFVERNNWLAIFVYSGVIAACVTATVLLCRTLFHAGQDFEPHFQNNVLFFTLVASQLLHVFNVSAETGKTRWFQSEEFQNPYVWLAVGICTVVTLSVSYIPLLAEVLGIHPLSLADLALITGGAITSAVIIRLLKQLRIVI